MRPKIIITLFTLIALPLLAASPNLLPGGSFDTPDTATRWLQAASRVSNDAVSTWIGVDALGSPDSGAMIMTGTGFISQCVAVTAGQSYDFGARVLVTTRDHLATPVAFLKLNFFSDAQCAAQSIGEAVTGNASLVGRFTAVSATAQSAPAGANSAIISVVMSQSGDVVLAPGSLRPSVYVDEAFLRATGDCAPDASTLCFARGTLRATVRVIGDDGATAAASAVQTSGTTGYFSTDGVDLPDVTIKTYDFAESSGSRWIVIGGLTNQKLQITVEDVHTHETKTYTNVSGDYLQPIVDVFFNP
jgi:hypothetical protein